LLGGFGICAPWGGGYIESAGFDLFREWLPWTLHLDLTGSGAHVVRRRDVSAHDEDGQGAAIAFVARLARWSARIESLALNVCKSGSEGVDLGQMPIDYLRRLLALRTLALDCSGECTF